MIERMRPLLGTFASIRVGNLPAAETHAAIDCGFAAIAEVHALMSFHEAASELSLLNREAWKAPVAVHPRVLEVLRHARAIAEASNGIFDVTVAGELVKRGVLPKPEDAPDPDPAASWRDVEISPEGNVCFARPLWIDLGGIAKGYAVDCAMMAMALDPSVQCLVNAGGDLRASGPDPEPVRLAMTTPDAVPVIEISNGSLASSTGAARWGAVRASHIDGVRRRNVGSRRFVSVAAQSCMTADALTKIVLASGAHADEVLRQFGATAYLYETRSGWRVVGQ